MKRLAITLLAVAACGPNYQDGKTKCASDGTCPDGFICGSKAPNLDVCFDLSKRPQCMAGQYLCSSGDCVASVADKDSCPISGSGGSTGGGGGMSTGGISGVGGISGGMGGETTISTGGMTNPIGGATTGSGGVSTSKIGRASCRERV